MSRKAKRNKHYIDTSSRESCCSAPKLHTIVPEEIDMVWQYKFYRINRKDRGTEKKEEKRDWVEMRAAILKMGYAGCGSPSTLVSCIVIALTEACN